MTVPLLNLTDMIKKTFLFGLVLLVAGQLLMAQSFQIITVSADGKKTSYALSNVQKIVFDNKTMTVNMKDGTDATNITNVSFSEVTGIESQKVESSIFIFPNPVKETLTVNGVKKDATIKLYGLTGGLLQTIPAQENSTNINVASLIPGVYLLCIGEQTIKFIKQ